MKTKSSCRGRGKCGMVPRLGKNRAAAFTLIELVISSALMALILAAGYACLSSGFRSQRLVETRAEMLQNGRLALALISADLRCACPLSKEIPFLGLRRTVGEMDADNIDFGTHNYTPRRARLSDFCETSYFLAPEPESGTMALWRRRDPTPDPEPLSGGSREEIARAVRGLRLEYYDGLEWYDEWGDPSGKGKASNSFKLQPNLIGMPEAVRITLWMGSIRDKENGENPMVFQTVCRLNLAGINNNPGGISGEEESPGKQPGDEPAAAPATGL